MWVKSFKVIAIILSFGLSACGSGSDGIVVGGPDVVTATGVLTVSGMGATTISPNGKVTPDQGREIINAANPYTLKFDDTTLAVNILYMETAGLYQLSVSSIGVTSSGVPYGSDYSVQSPIPLQGVTVDKVNHRLTLTQVLLPESNGGAASITVDGSLQVLGLP